MFSSTLPIREGTWLAAVVQEQGGFPSQAAWGPKPAGVCPAQPRSQLGPCPAADAAAGRRTAQLPGFCSC